jgi:hypothetical protein
LPLVERQNFLNDIVTNSPHLIRARSTVRPSTITSRGGQPTKKRTYEDPLVGASRIWKRGERAGFRRGRGRVGGRGGLGRTSPNIDRIDVSAIARALIPE